MRDGPGRPPLYTDPEQMRVVADAYFSRCRVEERIPTVNGLSLALNMTRMSLSRYRAKPEFADVIEMIYARMCEQWEQRLAGSNATGAIFWLKNQGWSDVQQQQISGPEGKPIESIQRVERVIVRPQDRDG